MTHWRQIINDTLGRKLVPKTSEIASDILCVCSGLKPGFLFDYGSVTSGQIRSLLQSALQEGLLVNNTLSIVSVATDVVIINPGRLEQHLHMLELKNNVRFVDVSGRLHLPELIEEESKHKIDPSTVCVRTILQHAAHQECGALKELSANLSSLVNVTTVYGLLLGYPIVYWYELDEGQEFGKCLSMEALRNVKVLGNAFQAGHTKGNNSCQTNNLQDCSSRQHLISSFSFPERFLPELKLTVEIWFSFLISVTNDPNVCFKMIRRTEEVISQSAVLL